MLFWNIVTFFPQFFIVTSTWSIVSRHICINICTQEIFSFEHISKTLSMGATNLVLRDVINYYLMEWMKNPMSHSFKHNLQIPLLTARCTTPLHPLYSEILKASCSTFKWFREMPENIPYFCNMKTHQLLTSIRTCKRTCQGNTWRSKKL